MLCEKCRQKEATRTSVFAAREVRLCDVCYTAMLEYFDRLQKLAEEYGTVIRLPSQGETIQNMVAEDSRFGAEAYEFAAEAMKEAFSEWCVEHAAECEHLLETREDKASFVGKVEDLKILSKQLVVALRRLASQRFGKCATITFGSWGVTCWQHFADIVSRMQKANVSIFWILAFREENFRSRGVLDDVFPER